MSEQITQVRALHASEKEQYHLLMENVKDYAIFLLDPGGRIASWNSGAERILGYREAEIVGQHFSCIFTPADIEKSEPAQELKRAAEGGRSDDERWHVRKDGSRLWSSGVVTALRDDAGKLRGFAKIMRDVTERKQTMEELAESSRRKDEFLAMLGHELRNPLSPILNAVFLIERDPHANAGQRQAAQMIERQTRKIVRLVDDLLDISRITRGKIQLRKECIRLRTVVNSAAESIRPLMDERKHTLSVTLPPESIWLDADPTRLEQVLTNLLSNAARYTEPGGRVWLTAEQAGTQALVRVRDTGIGIAAEMLPRIFEPFVQVERSIARTQGGLGIGLTVAQSLAQMHGGTIEAASAGIGKGSEFTVRLPFMPEAASSSPEAAAAMERRKGRSLRVLIAEDNVDAAETLATLLRLYGHEVSVVHSGTGVIPQMQACSPEVVLLDIGLPSLDGYEVARLVRRQQGFENVPLIAMTGYGQEADRQQSRQAGFDAHLVKPIDPDRLQDLLLRLGKS